MTRRAVIVLFWLEALLAAARLAEATRTAVAHPATVSTAMFEFLQFAVVVMFAVLVSVRGESARPNRQLIALVACTAAVVSVALLHAPSGTAPSLGVWAGEAVSMAGTAWVLVSVCFLGRCFGVLPEARGLVTRGPYGYVRHPVYLGELAAALGLVVAGPELRNVLLGTVFVVAQAVRMRLEEAELARAFPEYAHYARTTPRLVPRISGIDRPYGHASASRPTLRRARRT